jgi:hypothetical protein
VHREAPKPNVVKESFKNKFQTPIHLLMMMCPIQLWEIIVDETNQCADQKMKIQENRKRYIGGYKWLPVTLQDKMTYFGLLINGMLYLQTGRWMRDYWESPYLSPLTKFMSRGRFIQISSVLHFNDNEDVAGMENDGLHKVCPFVNIIKSTLRKYAVLGMEHSFDEATMACQSSFGRHLITFNI